MPPFVEKHHLQDDTGFIWVKRMYSVQNINGIDAREKLIKLKSTEMRERSLLPSSIYGIQFIDRE